MNDDNIRECIQHAHVAIRYPDGGALVLSGVNTARDLDRLRQLGIHTVVSVLPMTEMQLLPASVRHYIFAADDHPAFPISKWFERTYAVILAALRRNETVLVHCRAGVSRSVTIVIAFLLRTFADRLDGLYVRPYIPFSRGTWTDSILAFLRTRRWCVQPNSGFMEQLYAYESRVVRNTCGCG